MAFLKKLLVLVALFSAALAYRQQFSVYEQNSTNLQENSYIFERHTPNLPASFSGMRRFCVTGIILAYSKPNYESFLGRYGISGCYLSLPVGIQSFRYVGASETKEDAVSLYPGINYDGEEILVTHSPYGSIGTTMLSFGVTGKSAWTVFEDLNFTGKSACVPAPLTGCPAELTTEYLERMRAEWHALVGNF